MFLESKNNFRALLLLIAGCAGIFWFYYNFGQLDPLSTIKTDYSLDAAIAKSDSTLNSWQTFPEKLKTRTRLIANKGLIDSLQFNYGTKEFHKIMADESTKNFPLFYWQVHNYLDNEAEKLLSKMQITPSGEILFFEMSRDALDTLSPFNIHAVSQSLGLNFNPTFNNQAKQDSLIKLLLNFQNSESSMASNFAKIAELSKQLGSSSSAQSMDMYTEDRIWEGVQYYIQNSYWSRYSFKRDSLKFIDENGLRFVSLYMTSTDSVLSFAPSLKIDLLPAGGIKAIIAHIPERKVNNAPENNYARLLLQLLFLIFGIWLISVFYLRIKARAIDTQPAFVVAVLAGFLFSGSKFLEIIYNLELSFTALKDGNFTQDLFLIGFLGALSAILFFVLTSVSDSVTRQHWPSKLKAWDLARRGFFKNKPVGRSIICGLTIAGILTGIWTVLLQIVPNAYLLPETNFSALNAEFPSIVVSIENLFGSLLLVIGVFMILGNQLYAFTRNKWFIPILSGFLFALFIGPFMSTFIYPLSAEIIINFLIGFGFGVFYLNYGFLTMVFSLFVFLGFFTTRSGWLFSHSPDANTFYFFIATVVTLSGAGVYFLITGNERKDLPDYVPSYIEDQAKEQRLEQELEIAHEVQKTFLPSRVAHMKGLDIAGVCEPAQETGGDYYDMISLGKKRMAIAIGDVSGKGIQAAFYMTFVKGVLHSLSTLILSPVELLNQLNRLFNENATRGTFISMIYGILEADKRTFTFSRAGHNPLLVVRASGETEWLQPPGVGIGLSKGELFRSVTIEMELKLQEGDVAILYTDGITEMLNISNQFYGESRLEKIVQKHRTQPSSYILNTIIDDVTQFKGVAKQHDDMTLVVIKADASVNN